jgi:hypothetical protein
MKKKDCLIRKNQKKEIIYNVVNSLLAGALVLLGSFSVGEITLKGFCFAALASLAVAVGQFKNYWESEKKEYSNLKLFAIIR